jgi:F420-dependent oxidoreductase-like protein
MRISISVTNYSWPSGTSNIAAELARLGRAADEGGIDTLWVADHLLQADPASTIDEPMLEAYTTLGFLAAQTSRVRLGTMVAGVAFRPLALLIKAVTTLDVLSGGRAWLGIGAGYNDDEAQAMGLPMPPTSERFDRLESVLELAGRMWSGDDSPYEGPHDRLGHPVGQPRPLSEPRPPILVGGTGEKRTLRYVAQYADACNVFDIPDGGQTIRRKLDVLRGHCEAVGRPYEEIDKTVSTALTPGESAESFADRCRALGEYGLEHVVVITRGQPWSDASVTTITTAVSMLQTSPTAHDTSGG